MLRLMLGTIAASCALASGCRHHFGQGGVPGQSTRAKQDDMERHRPIHPVSEDDSCSFMSYGVHVPATISNPSASMLPQVAHQAEIEEEAEFSDSESDSSTSESAWHATMIFTISQPSRVLQLNAVNPNCVHDWRIQMALKFGQGWHQPPPEDMTDLAPVIAAALEHHTAAQAPAAAAPAETPDSDVLLMLVRKHLRRPLPWNAWQHLLARLHRHVRSHHVDITYLNYAAIMEESFGVQWRTARPSRSRMIRKTLQETWNLCISDLLRHRRPRTRKRTHGRQRLRKIICELMQNLLELSPGLPVTHTQLARTRALAHRALRTIGGFPRRMHPNSLANLM